MIRHSSLYVTVAAAAFSLMVGNVAMAQVLDLAAEPAVAESGALGKFSDLKVTGNQRVEAGTVETYLGLKRGEAISEDDLNEGLKRLYATELFSDASVKLEGDVVVVTVKENPVVNRVEFEGNDKYKDEDLSREIQSKPRGVYTRAKVSEDAERVMELYKRSGRFQASVVPKIIQREQNRVDVVFEVTEGAITKIQGVNFVGNSVFSDRELRSVVTSESSKWYKFFSSSDTYDPDRVNFDKEKLRRYYVSNGYADFKVNSVVTELSPDDNGFYLTYHLEEGAHYSFGTVKAESSFADVTPDEMKEAAKTIEGEEYNATLVEESVDAMADILGDRGYAFAKVEPKITRNAESRTIDVIFKAEEASRVYVDRINVTGNLRTMDEVIRREFRLSEGDPFSTTKLKRSEERVKNLNFFDKVEVSTSPGSAPDRANINVDVSEKSTGELSLGAGFSTLDGALFDIGLREDNLMGAGREIKARAMIAQERQEIDIGYTEPWFLDREIAAGFDVFNTSQDFRNQSSYDKRSVGGRLRAAYALSEHLEHSLAYTIREDEVTNVRAGASRFIAGQEGTYATSMISQALTYDRRNNKFDPSKGFYVRLSQDVAGLGGDADYLRHEARAGWFYSIVPQWVFQVTGGGGHILGFDEDVRINDRFFVGSRQIRGFDDAGIGPRDASTGDALGGKSYFTGTVELGFPIDISEDLGLRGAVFSDIANLWDSDESGTGVLDESALRASAGVGIAWASPFGPIRLDFAEALVKEEYDEEQFIKFSFGTRF